MHGFQMTRARCRRRLHRLHRQEVGQEIVLLEEILTYIEEVCAYAYYGVLNPIHAPSARWI